MEGQRPSTGSYPLHVCYWRKPDRLCRPQIHEPIPHRTKLAMDNRLHFTCDHTLAAVCIACQHPIRPVPVFYKIPPQDRHANEISQTGKDDG